MTATKQPKNYTGLKSGGRVAVFCDRAGLYRVATGRGWYRLERTTSEHPFREGREWTAWVLRPLDSDSVGGANEQFDLDPLPGHPGAWDTLGEALAWVIANH